jgi:23S rRNA pseudouridine1911/1915/1917 synthase
LSHFAAIEITLVDPAGRLDRALADALPDFSRARIQALMLDGAVSRDTAVMDDPSARAEPGRYRLVIPPPAPASPAPEDLALTVLFEDPHLIVIDKPAGMSAHPAPGSPAGTLVNALIHHCGDSLSGIGGVARPGIVHRLDKLTSGVMVAAKTDLAHRGLSALFAAHDLDRAYVALTRGSPSPARGCVATRIGRSPRNRKKMAVLSTGGREAVTHYAVVRAFGPRERPLAAKVSCTLETGRTHQIRVHLAHKGAPCLGDPAYGAGMPAPVVRAAISAAGLKRQALHAGVLAFRHPITGEALRFETAPPADMTSLEAALAAL